MLTEIANSGPEVIRMSALAEHENLNVARAVSMCVDRPDRVRVSLFLFQVLWDADDGLGMCSSGTAWTRGSTPAARDRLQ
jgi:hypothetical protein